MQELADFIKCYQIKRSKCCSIIEDERYNVHHIKNNNKTFTLIFASKRFYV